MKAGANPSPRTRGQLSIAMVDADAPTCHAFADWVERTRGVRCAGIYHGGESALAALSAARPHIVLLEIQLNGLDGIACLGRLKPRLPGTHFLMYTDYADADHVFAALAAGATGYFVKATPVEALLAAIKRNYLKDGVHGFSRSDASQKVLECFHRGVSGPADLNLPRRQQDVLDLMVQGLSSPEIAKTLRIGCATVETHTRRIFKKLGVCSRTQVMARFTQFGTASLHTGWRKPGQAGQNGRLVLEVPPLPPRGQLNVPAPVRILPLATRAIEGGLTEPRIAPVPGAARSKAEALPCGLRAFGN
jgi:DNA-binding NarL/FixJ family response regulator